MDATSALSCKLQLYLESLYDGLFRSLKPNFRVFPPTSLNLANKGVCRNAMQATY